MAKKNIKAKKTNIEFVNDFMNYCPTGALGQCFLIDAVTKVAELAAKNRIPDNGLIHPDAWQATAKAWLAAYKENYE
jgi:hypothetical protein